MFFWQQKRGALQRSAGSLLWSWELALLLADIPRGRGCSLSSISPLALAKSLCAPGLIRPCLSFWGLNTLEAVVTGFHPAPGPRATPRLCCWVALFHHKKPPRAQCFQHDGLTGNGGVFQKVPLDPFLVHSGHTSLLCNQPELPCYMHTSPHKIPNICGGEGAEGAPQSLFAPSSYKTHSMYTYGWSTWPYSRNEHYVVHQLYFHTIQF